MQPRDTQGGIEDQLFEIVDEFERRWESGDRPEIEAFLDRVDQTHRPRLLRELLIVEMSRLDDAGSPFTTAEYRERFEDTGVIEEALNSFREHQATRSRRSTQIERKDGDSLFDSKTTQGDRGESPRVMGRYKILRELGRGGFATVFLAQDTDLDREVALKVPRLDRFGGEDGIKFFLEEAQKAAQLDHPGIARIYDVQRDNVGIYIVQQYVSGGDLTRHTKNELLEPRKVARLMVAVAESLGYAHQRGYIHLDLKPDNILLDAEGKPSIVDFGLALHESKRLNRRGEVFGTYAYMSPAQARGEVHRLDGRSDIWSLGVTFYELLTGGRPFDAESVADLLDQLEHRQPTPPHRINAEVPNELSRICLTCLAKRTSDRYATIEQLADDLVHWLDNDAEDRTKNNAIELDELHVIPQGLRRFGPEHAEFFLSLLPGPHDRDGLPKPVRFWKTRIESRDRNESFPVGVLFGPSGCGKSSMIGAGLLPVLEKSVSPLRIECSASETETLIKRALLNRFTDFDQSLSLVELVSTIRAEGGLNGQKVLIILDQFEQWLSGRSIDGSCELIQALRHCDGVGIQCLVSVRDDFWMSTNRFMQAIEVPVIEGENSGAVDLFDKSHAESVLAAFARAYGKLPKETEPTPQQKRFLARAVGGWQTTGK